MELGSNNILLFISGLISIFVLIFFFLTVYRINKIKELLRSIEKIETYRGLNEKAIARFRCKYCHKIFIEQYNADPDKLLCPTCYNEDQIGTEKIQEEN